MEKPFFGDSIYQTACFAAGQPRLRHLTPGSFMRFYLDIDGNDHGVSAGVTTLYVLDADGNTIRYADPWLPPKFDHLLDTPEKGRFIAESMSVSGSTVFLMNASHFSPSFSIILS